MILFRNNSAVGHHLCKPTNTPLIGHRNFIVNENILVSYRWLILFQNNSAVGHHLCKPTNTPSSYHFTFLSLLMTIFILMTKSLKKWKTLCEKWIVDKRSFFKLVIHRSTLDCSRFHVNLAHCGMIISLPGGTSTGTTHHYEGSTALDQARTIISMLPDDNPVRRIDYTTPRSMKVCWRYGLSMLEIFLIPAMEMYCILP